MRIGAFVFLLVFPCLIFAQRRDSTMAVGGITRDTHYIIHENICKHKLWGNSFYTGASYMYSRSHEFMFSFGRTYGKVFAGGGGAYFYMRSWGIGYSYYRRGDIDGNVISAFAEVSAFPLPPGTARLEYLYDVTTETHYLRPSVGLSFFALDFLYTYSFRLSGEVNHFRHGALVRFKYYINNDNWEKSYPNRC